MDSIDRFTAEKYITQIFFDYLKALKKAKRNKKQLIPETNVLFEGMDDFKTFIKSPDLQLRVYNRLNLEGLKELFNGCCILAKAYELESYKLVKDCYIIDNEHYFKLNSVVSSFSAGGTYKFNLECMSDTQKEWYQYYGKSWYCYKLNPNTNKYEEYKEGLGEYRSLCDTNTNDRAFLFKEPGQYKITASVFQNSINPFDGVFGKLQEVETIEITVIDDSDPAIVNLGLKEKYIRAIQYADLGTAFASLGMDIAGIALTIIAFVGIGFILKKVPAGKLKPFLTKVAKKFALPELLTFFGTVGDAFDVAAFIGAVCSFDEQVKNAKNEEHLKLAGKTWEKVIETFGLVAVMTFMNVVGRKMKKSDIETEIASFNKNSPEDILTAAGYKDKGIIGNNDYKKQIEELQLILSDEDLINSLSKMKKKGIKKSLEHITKINDIIEKLNIPYKGIAIENADQIYDLRRYYSQPELIEILNNTTPDEFETTIKKLVQIQEELLVKRISSGDTNKFAREMLTKLKLKHGITEERLNVLRNLDYNKMSQDDYEKIKPEIDAIINLTRLYDLNKVKPGMMRKYIPVEDVEKYLSGRFDGIGGFIARQEDVLQLMTFDDVFYTMRLDYEGNKFIYQREIAYIDFTSIDYSKTYVPIAKKHGGIKDWNQPFEGLGVTKAKNNQLVREYTLQDNSYLALEEAVMYKIDKNGNHIKIAEFNKILKQWKKI